MTRLDTVIERLKAQRSCLNAAAEALRGNDGHILELGLGNGRTYDHLRDLFPDRDIYVFDLKWLRIRTAALIVRICFWGRCPKRC